MHESEPRRWTVADAAELYEIAAWGKGYFSANAAGHICVHPDKDPQRSIDLKLLVDQLKTRGIELPVLIRVGDILKHRLAEIQAAFAQAIREHGYRGAYQCIYPIKVNQQRQVVEEVLSFGRPGVFAEHDGAGQAAAFHQVRPERVGGKMFEAAGLKAGINLRREDERSHGGQAELLHGGDGVIDLFGQTDGGGVGNLQQFGRDAGVLGDDFGDGRSLTRSCRSPASVLAERSLAFSAQSAEWIV